MESEPNDPDSIHQSVRRLLRWRYLVVAGVSVAAWVAIGSTSAFAADPGQVNQSNTNTSVTSVDSSGGQSAGLIGGPIVAPVTVGVQTNAAGPVNLNLLGNQAGSGSAGGGSSQSNVNGSSTVVDNRNAQSAGVISGPVVAPVNVGVQTNGSGPVNANAASNQRDSGNGLGGDVSQSNANGSSTVVDNRNAQSAGAVAGPIVAPVTLGLQTNLEGPVNGNVASNQVDSGNGAAGERRQVNGNRSTTVVDNGGAQSAGLVSGPIVVPVTGQLATNAGGPVNLNALSSQRDSGNAGGGGNGPLQANGNESVTAVSNRRAQSAGAVSGPIVMPISPQVGTNLAGPVNLNGAANQAGSGNASDGGVRQGNFNGSFTGLSNEGAQSAGAVSGPIVAPVSPQVGTNLAGPVNGNLLSNQRDSGSGGSVDQVNDNAALTLLDNRGAQSAAGPIVAPVSPQVGTNLNGPANLNAVSNQAGSGNGPGGEVRQGDFNAALTQVDNRGAQSAAGAVGGPVVVPISPQVGTNLNGPVNGNLFSNQMDSGDDGTGAVRQLNWNWSWTWVDNGGAKSAGVVAGPVVAPVSPQVGTNLNGPVNLNALADQAGSGNGSAGDVHQLNWNGSWTWVGNGGAESAGVVAGPVVAPVSPQVGTNLNGPVNLNALANQAGSGNGSAGDVHQLNWNGSWTWVGNGGAESAGVVAGPVVAPVSPQVGTNLNGPFNLNLLSNQKDSGNGGAGDVSQSNVNRSFAGLASTGGASQGAGLTGPAVVPFASGFDTNLNGPASASVGGDQSSGNPGPTTMNMVSAAAVRDSSGPGGPMGVLLAALAGLTALGSQLIRRRRSVR